MEEPDLSFERYAYHFWILTVTVTELQGALQFNAMLMTEHGDPTALESY
jgi:hypothetical protein